MSHPRNNERPDPDQHPNENENENEDVVLAEDDIEDIIEDDDESYTPPPEDEAAKEEANKDAAPRTARPEDGADDDDSDDDERDDRPVTAIGATFLHTPKSAVFALALHPCFPNPPIAVSGGQDDLAYLFCPLPSRRSPSSSRASSPGPSGAGDAAAPDTAGLDSPGTAAAAAESSAPASSSASIITAEGTFTRDEFKPIQLTGHTDSVVAAAFSADGEYVATGGMDGRVRVWRRVTKRKGKPIDPKDMSAESWKYWEFITSLEAGGEVHWLAWHPRGPVLAAGCEDTSVWLWQLPSGRTMTVLSSHTFACTAGMFTPPAGKQLLTTSLDNSLVLWNPAAGTYEFKLNVFCSHLPALDPSLHGITALAVHPYEALAAVGAAGGRVRLVSLPKEGKPGGIVVNTLEGHGRGESVESLVFLDLLHGADGGKGVVLVSGGTDGRCFVWDSVSGRVRAELRHPEPVTAVVPHPAPCQYLVTTASTDRTARTWDVRTGTLLAEHVGHAGSVNSVAVAPAPDGWESPLGLPQAQIIISGGDEGASLIWRV